MLARRLPSRGSRAWQLLARWWFDLGGRSVSRCNFLVGEAPHEETLASALAQHLVVHATHTFFLTYVGARQQLAALGFHCVARRALVHGKHMQSALEEK